MVNFAQMDGRDGSSTQILPCLKRYRYAISFEKFAIQDFPANFRGTSGPQKEQCAKHCHVHL